MGTEAFLIINFVEYDRYYRLDFPLLEKAWKGWKNGEGVNEYSNIASIPYEWFEQHLTPLKSKNGITLDYLKLIN